MTSLSPFIKDVKRLSEKLKNHESFAENIISKGKETLRNVEALRDYHEDLEDLNRISAQSHRSRSYLIQGIEKEKRQLRQLDNENKELRSVLEEYQNATELIMSKYRQHLSHMVNSSKIEKDFCHYSQSGALQDRADKICEMASVMNYAITIDEENQTKEKEILSKLITENRGLREMLEISRKNGSYSNPLLRPKMVCRLIQTEDSSLFDSDTIKRQSRAYNSSSDSISSNGCCESAEEEENNSTVCSSTNDSLHHL